MSSNYNLGKQSIVADASSSVSVDENGTRIRTRTRTEKKEAWKSGCAAVRPKKK